MKILPPISTRAEAHAKGQKFFFTGKACRKGHISPRYVSTMGCLDCLVAYKREGAKNPYRHDLIPYTPDNVWRSALWDAATLAASHAVVQEALDAFAKKIGTPVAPEAKFKRLYGEWHVSNSTVTSESGEVFDLWYTRSGQPRKQIQIVQRGETVGEPLFTEDGLDGSPWVYVKDRWYACTNIDYAIFPVIALPDSTAWAKFGMDGTHGM